MSDLAAECGTNHGFGLTILALIAFGQPIAARARIGIRSCSSIHPARGILLGWNRQPDC